MTRRATRWVPLPLFPYSAVAVAAAAAVAGAAHGRSLLLFVMASHWLVYYVLVLACLFIQRHGAHRFTSLRRFVVAWVFILVPSLAVATWAVCGLVASVALFVVGTVGTAVAVLVVSVVGAAVYVHTLGHVDFDAFTPQKRTAP